MNTIIQRLLRLSMLKTQQQQLVNPAHNLLRAYRCYDGNISSVSPISGEGTPLNENLRTNIGKIEIANQVFQLQEDGIYRFYRLPVISEQRIVCQGGLDSLLKMIGYLWAYGKESKICRQQDFPQLSKQCLVASCTKLSLAAKYVLSLFSINSRIIAIATAKDWGGFDDGHTMLEIDSGNGNWFVYDPSFNCCIKGKNGRLSLLEFVEASRSGEFGIEKFPGNNGHRNFIDENYDYGFWIDERMHSSDMLIEWYKRLCEIPLIQYGEKYYFPEETTGSSKLADYKPDYQAINKLRFIDKFYPELNA